eukprot:m.748251 g.748251  ORF g.748251 m.748251 type:complete len:373 (-) comp23148_c0_seq33:99-1217(-)
MPTETRTSSSSGNLSGKIKIQIPEYDGKHNKYVAWVSKFIPYLTMIVGISIIATDGSVDDSSTEEEENILMFVLTQALSGRAARIARKSQTGTKTWEALRADFDGPAAEKLEAAKQKLKLTPWKNDKSMLKAVERFQEQIDTVTEEITTYGGSDDFPAIRSHILSVLPSVFDSARTELMHATDSESMFTTIAAHAAVLDSRQSTTSAALFSTQGPGTTKKFNGTCHNCGIKGHKKSECRKPANSNAGRKSAPPKPCKFCNGNHWNNECPKKNNGNQEFIKKNFEKLRAYFTSEQSTQAHGTTHRVESQKFSSAAPSLMTAAALLSALGTSDGSLIQPQPIHFAGAILGIPVNSTAFILDSGCTSPLVANKNC